MAVEADGMSFEQARKRLQIPMDQKIEIDQNRRFVDGDHWQDGTGWIGPQPDPTDPNVMDIFARLQISFTSKNLLAEVCHRIVGAIIGQEPDWHFVPRVKPAQIEEVKTNPVDQTQIKTGRMIDAPPNDKDKALIEEANDICVKWWDDRIALQFLQSFLMKRLSLGHGILRYFIPPGKLQPTPGGPTVVPRAKDTMEAIMKFVHVETPEPEVCKMVLDLEQMEFYGVTLYERIKDLINIAQVIEIVFVDDNGKTIIETLEEETSLAGGSGVIETEAADEPQQFRSDPMDLGGNITVHESFGTPLISEPMRQNQRFINLALTMMAHNVVESGFSERTLINANIPGEEVDDLSSPTGKRIIPDSQPRGAGVIHSLVGLSYRDAQGNIQLTTPTVHDREPGSVDAFTKTTEEGTWNILEEVQQLHALISGDAAPSGESRIQALSDFVMSCLPIKTIVEKAGRHMLEIIVALAAQFAGTPGKFASLRADFQCKLYVGQLNAQERAALLAELTAKVRSRRGVQIELGITDPDAEDSAILTETLIDRAINPPPIPDPNVPGLPGNPNQPPVPKPGAPGRPQAA